MPRAALVTLLVAFILSGSLYAQHAGGAFHGNPVGLSFHPPSSGQRGSPTVLLRSMRGIFPSRFRLRRDNFGAVVGTYFVPYDEPLGHDGSNAEGVGNQLEPPVVILQRDDRQSDAQQNPPAQPHLIEIPGAPSSTAAKPLPPTIFVLATGERLEAVRFVLTASSLSVTIDRHQRTVPIDLLDINATIAANHERGIDLRIPADRNEISLSF